MYLAKAEKGFASIGTDINYNSLFNIVRGKKKTDKEKEITNLKHATEEDLTAFPEDKQVIGSGASVVSNTTTVSTANSVAKSIEGASAKKRLAAERVENWRSRRPSGDCATKKKCEPTNKITKKQTWERARTIQQHQTLSGAG